MQIPNHSDETTPRSPPDTGPLIQGSLSNPIKSSTVPAPLTPSPVPRGLRNV